MQNEYTLKSHSLFAKSMDSNFFLVNCLLVSVHLLLLFGFVFYQFFEPLFLNADTWVFIYLLLFLSFSIDFVYFYFYEKVKKQVVFQWLFLFLDSVLMTVCLSTVVPVLHPALIFVYMLQIFSAGLLWQYKGAFIQGLLVSMLFTWVLIFDPSVANSGSSLFISFLVNNIGFISVAGLSGFFGSQARKMKWSLVAVDKALGQLENLNELIVDNINMGLFILDERTFIIHSNKTALSILNLPPSVSMPVHTIFPELREHIVSNAVSEINRLNVEYREGSNTKQIEIFVSPVKQSGKVGKKYLVLFQDCTKMCELEKKEHEKEKFASIGRMATGIAHELRNPLSSIGGSIQLLDIHKKHSSENRRLMDIALREISRLNGIIGEFLDYTADGDSYLNKIAMGPIQVNSILEDILDNVRVNRKWEHIKYHFTLKSHGLIQGHSDKFKQIFLNVVKNACEAMENQSEGQLGIESFDDNEWVVVRVKDVGVGISNKDKPYIYEPFYSTKERGTGLGLAIVHKLVLLYKGHLSYEKNNKKGTVCTLRFPIQPNFCPGEMAQKKIA